MSNILKEKTRLKNEYYNKISLINKNISRLEEANHNLVRSGLEKTFVESSKEKNKVRMDELKNELNLVENELQNLDNGLMDKEIEERLEKSKLESAVKIKEQQQKLQQKKNEKEDEIKLQEKRKDDDRKVNSDYRSKEWEIDRAYNHYLRTIDRCPEYIKNNLKEMPNNKGYIFNDVIFLGELPREKNQHEIYFEKGRDGVLIIHEHFKDRTRITKKYSDGKKEIVFEEERENKNLFNNDFVVFKESAKKQLEKELEDKKLEEKKTESKKRYNDRREFSQKQPYNKRSRPDISKGEINKKSQTPKSQDRNFKEEETVVKNNYQKKMNKKKVNK